MERVWFCFVALLLSLYIVLDGFDLGTGIVHFWVARTDEERRQVIAVIGPVWDGNEVLLIAGGGTLFFAFPVLYASSFSGFYLPLMLVLWLLILRGLSIELRSHAASDLWKSFWDAGFSAASALLAVFFGTALGNVIRGVPLDSSGFFFLPFWTHFRPTEDAGILDWFTVSIGVAAGLVLAMHGALWVALKTDGEIAERSKRAARRIWWCVAAFTALITVLSFRIQPHIAENFGKYTWGYIFPAFALIGLLGVQFAHRTQTGWVAFLASSVYICGMLASAAFGIYPYVLPSNRDPKFSLSIHNASAAPYGLAVGLWWWIPGMLLAAFYFLIVYRYLGAKTSPKEY